jgi:hypothetical protein
MGLHPSEILQGYELARDKALEELESELRRSPRVVWVGAPSTRGPRGMKQAAARTEVGTMEETGASGK